ncbi:hypothetical protein E0H73_19620 [Kribbella pittospori]|uniref:IPT/TIG domain-containing protein n=1 Tax=Kribbella pittospori TaxID=722689 RepID=A0A4R0KPS8_9ACTN|nr:hypothetical protein [Kribbella pittospori]TCC60178.1 hypothetical protein E0H73_19620 [Kribbella pittospori]
MSVLARRLRTPERVVRGLCVVLLAILLPLVPAGAAAPLEAAPLAGEAPAFGLSGITPAVVAAGTTATLTVHGELLESTDVVRFTARGRPPMAGVVTSVSADHAAATVAVDLTKATPGAWDLMVAATSGEALFIPRALMVSP